MNAPHALPQAHTRTYTLSHSPTLRVFTRLRGSRCGCCERGARDGPPTHGRRGQGGVGQAGQAFIPGRAWVGWWACGEGKRGVGLSIGRALFPTLQNKELSLSLPTCARTQWPARGRPRPRRRCGGESGDLVGQQRVAFCATSALLGPRRCRSHARLKLQRWVRVHTHTLSHTPGRGSRRAPSRLPPRPAGGSACRTGPIRGGRIQLASSKQCVSVTQGLSHRRARHRVACAR